MTTPGEAPVAVQKPRLVLMGEFSSGKSTLSNILLGGPTLPVQVTATRLPPVYVTHGAPSAHAIARDGSRREVDLTDLGALSPDEIRSLHITMISDTLELCDLVDMPGISDPNMAADTWDGVVRSSDHIIWCTHATQAWRQSEAAMWDRLRDATSGINLLLVTQFDKLRNPRDRTRVLNRVATETAGKFTATYPVSLLDALGAGDDLDRWKASGAHAFMEHLIDILLTPPGPAVPQPAPVAENVIEIPRPAAPDQTAVRANVRVTPRRVQVKPGTATPERPPRRAEAFAPAGPGAF